MNPCKLVAQLLTSQPLSIVLTLTDITLLDVLGPSHVIKKNQSYTCAHRICGTVPCCRKRKRKREREEGTRAVWTVLRQVCFQENDVAVWIIKINFSAFSSPKSVSQVFALCHSMDRFVSKRSSSSLNLAASALDDVRAERAAIALSVGLSWPPDRYTKTRGLPS